LDVNTTDMEGQLAIATRVNCQDAVEPGSVVLLHMKSVSRDQLVSVTFEILMVKCLSAAVPKAPQQDSRGIRLPHKVVGLFGWEEPATDPQ
jgi:hypothetical protein